MQLDPLGFMEVLKSDNTSGFTLNWGPDTSSMEEDKIIYDGKEWSFDGLWTAATKGAIVERDGGVNKEPVKLETTSTSGKPSDAGSEVAYEAWKLSYRFTTSVQESGLSFKVFAESARKSDESITVSISYKPKGETAPKTAVFNAYYGGAFKVRDGVDANTGVFTTTTNFDIYLPKVLNQSTTGGQVGQEIDLSTCDSVTVTIYATYYMEIGNIPVATTLTAANFKVK